MEEADDIPLPWVQPSWRVPTQSYRITGSPPGTEITDSGKQCVYLCRLVPSRMRVSVSSNDSSPIVFSREETKEIMKHNELRKIFKSVRIGWSASEAGALRKIYNKSCIISFAVLEFIVINVPSGMSGYLFEQLLLLKFSQTSNDQPNSFGEYRFGVKWSDVEKVVKKLKDIMYSRWGHRATVQRGFLDARQGNNTPIRGDDGGDAASIFYLIQYC